LKDLLLLRLIHLAEIGDIPARTVKDLRSIRKACKEVRSGKVESRSVCQQGAVRWDGRNERREKTASGVYIGAHNTIFA